MIINLCEDKIVNYINCKMKAKKKSEIEIEN